MNFVFFIPDEMRAESTSIDSDPVVKTPNLEKLASEGTMFSKAYVQHPVCTPSRCSFMTGWYPHVRGHRTLWHLLRPDEPNLLKYFKKAGYEIGWFGKNDLLSTASAEESVDFVVTGSGPRVGPLLPHEDPKFNTFAAEAFDEKKQGQNMDEYLVKSAADFIKGKHDKPFVAYIPTTLPHPDYSSPEPWHSSVNPDDISELRKSDLENKPDFHTLIRKYRGLDKVEDEFLKTDVNAKYLGAIAYADYLLGILLDAVKESGLEDETTFIFTSDHGDFAGDYGLVEKWPSALDDTISRVPFVIKAPGMKKGHVVDTPVEIFDMVPTTLEIAGIELEHTQFGKSLVPQLEGAAGDIDRIAFCEGGYGEHEPHCLEGRNAGSQAGRNAKNIYYQKGKQQQDYPASVCRTVMMRTMTHKLIFRTKGLSELYDMEKDRRELDNLYGKPEAKEVQLEMEKKMLEWFVETSDVTPFDEDPRGHEHNRVIR